MFFKLLINLQILIFLSSFNCAQGKRLAHIIDGTIGDITDFPHQAALLLLNKIACGATIIDKYYVISAAHCVNFLTYQYDENEITDEVEPSVIKVGVGIKHGKNVKKEYEIDLMSYNRLFGNTTDGNIPYDHDLALFRLKTPLAFGKTVRGIQLTDREPKKGDIATISGYGVTEPNRRSMSSFRQLQTPKDPGPLRFIKIPVVDRHECNKTMHSQFESVITKNMICAGTKKGIKDSCSGDSGGPMVVNDKLAGVISWGEGCGKPGVPGVYASIHAMRKWIDKKIEKMDELAKKKPKQAD